MKEIEKRINLEDGNIMFLDISKGYTVKTSIHKYYVYDKKVTKTISFSMWDDFSFYGWNSEGQYELDTLEFEFDINDPIYFCLNRLLANKQELLIDDDESGIMRRYMVIKKETLLIKIYIYDYKTDAERVFETPHNKFNVFIKNIGPDPRSKIQDYKEKLKLIMFFRDCRERLLEEYHQMTIDEYLEILRHNSEMNRIKQKTLK